MHGKSKLSWVSLVTSVFSSLSSPPFCFLFLPSTLLPSSLCPGDVCRHSTHSILLLCLSRKVWIPSHKYHTFVVKTISRIFLWMTFPFLCKLCVLLACIQTINHCVFILYQQFSNAVITRVYINISWYFNMYNHVICKSL